LKGVWTLELSSYLIQTYGVWCTKTMTKIMQIDKKKALRLKI